VTGYCTWLHGEAVAAGLQMAATLSAEAGWMPETQVARLSSLLLRLGLRTDAAEVPAAQARAAMSIDKKARSGQLRFVLMRGVGAAFVTADYPAAALENTLRRHFG
jgi:3-dehydroquinate synthase